MKIIVISILCLSLLGCATTSINTENMTPEQIEKAETDKRERTGEYITLFIEMVMGSLSGIGSTK
jgi:hypothetical protein